MAGGLAREVHARHPGARRVEGVENVDQPKRLGRREPAQRDAFGRGEHGRRSDPRARRGEDEAPSTVGRKERMGEERDAVPIRPLQVVEEDDERPAGGEGGEEPLELVERATSKRPNVLDRTRPFRRLGDRLDAPQDREHGGEVAHAPLDERRDLLGAAEEPLAEIVDDAIGAGERDGLLLVAPPPQDERIVRELRQKVLDEVALPDSRLPLDNDHPRLARSLRERQ